MTPDLSVTVHRALNAVVAFYGTAGVTLPARQYVAPGTAVLVAVDEEQVTANVNRLYSGLPGTQQAGPVLHQLSVRSVEIAVQIFRTVHIITDDGNPTPAEMAADFEAECLDIETLWNALEDARARYLIVDQGVPFALNDVMSIGPDGGYAGVMGTFTVAVT